jgi:hypothetical protein
VIVHIQRASAPHHCLLTRKAQYPKGMHTCIAGFIEPGESVEEAVGREVWEECGLRVVAGSVAVVGSQPWPFAPGGGVGQLMIGCVCAADGTSTFVWLLSLHVMCCSSALLFLALICCCGVVWCGVVLCCVVLCCAVLWCVVL